MKFKKNFTQSAVLATLVMGLSACSSRPEIKEFPSSARADQEMTNLQLAIENARKENVDILAPIDYKEARTSLKESRELDKDNKSDERVLKEIALGRAYLDRAHKTADKTENKLVDVVAAREAAMKADAHIILKGNFDKHDNKVKEETAKLEKDDDADLKENRSKFITGYYDLELNAIKQASLGESRTLIDTAARNGARDLVPNTFNEANTSYSEADAFITKNRHNKEEIQVKAAAALTAAQKLEQTTNTARGITTTSPEETALRMQAEQARLGKTESELSKEKRMSAALSASNSELSKDQQLNAAFEEARSKFSSDEAEVYKQGNNLVIRLRGLEFPNNQAVIRGENFALLKKVDEVINNFDQSSVMVEGHTDSTGSKALNQKLSDQRAAAVMQYLEANSSEKVLDFESKGFGFEKPLASNKSAEGRAQNRRVDVIIEPKQM